MLSKNTFLLNNSILNIHLQYEFQWNNIDSIYEISVLLFILAFKMNDTQMNHELISNNPQTL